MCGVLHASPWQTSAVASSFGSNFAPARRLLRTRHTMRCFAAGLKVSLLLVSLQGCAAQQLRTAGETTLGIGGVTTGVGLFVATGIDPTAEDDPATLEDEGARLGTAYPKEGIFTMAAGLVVMLVGGVLVGLAEPAAPPVQAPPAPAGSVNPL